MIEMLLHKNDIHYTVHTVYIVDMCWLGSSLRRAFVHRYALDDDVEKYLYCLVDFELLQNRL